MKKLATLAIIAFAAAIFAFGHTPEPASAQTPTPIAVATPDLGCPCVYLHAERTDISLGQSAKFSLEMLNGLTKPEMTVQLILRIPSGWSVDGRGFDNECSGQCSAVYTVPTSKQERIEIFVKPNEAGDYRLEGTTQWFFTGDPSNARVETEVMSVSVRENGGTGGGTTGGGTGGGTDGGTTGGGTTGGGTGGGTTGVSEKCPGDRLIWIPPNQNYVCVAGIPMTWVLIGIILALITLLATVATLFKRSS